MIKEIKFVVYNLEGNGNSDDYYGIDHRYHNIKHFEKPEDTFPIYEKYYNHFSGVNSRKVKTFLFSTGVLIGRYGMTKIYKSCMEEIFNQFFENDPYKDIRWESSTKIEMTDITSEYFLKSYLPGYEQILLDKLFKYCTIYLNDNKRINRNKHIVGWINRLNRTVKFNDENFD